MEPVRRRRAETKPDSFSGEDKLTVHATHLGSEKETTKTLRVRKFEVEPAYVRVNAGLTKSLAPYESLRIDVALTIPCYVEEIDTVFGKVADRVSAYLEEEVKNYTEN